MTKPYHITPEQALELANEVEAAGFDITVYQDGGVEGHTVEAFQAFANAALDKVLGELVGYYIEDSEGGRKLLEKNEGDFNSREYEKCGFTLNPLYAPKELK